VQGAWPWYRCSNPTPIGRIVTEIWPSEVPYARPTEGRRALTETTKRAWHVRNFRSPEREFPIFARSSPESRSISDGHICGAYSAGGCLSGRGGGGPPDQLPSCRPPLENGENGKNRVHPFSALAGVRKETSDNRLLACAGRKVRPLKCLVNTKFPTSAVCLWRAPQKRKNTFVHKMEVPYISKTG
jgi:hypothetical protein